MRERRKRKRGLAVLLAVELVRTDPTALTHTRTSCRKLMFIYCTIRRLVQPDAERLSDWQRLPAGKWRTEQVAELRQGRAKARW